MIWSLALAMERNVKDEQRARERGSLMDWLQETMIYKQFVSQGPSDDYKSSVKKTCSIAINLSSDIVLSFTHFTRHDYVHIQNVIKIMENLLGAEGIAHLSCDEAAMLLLCACWHDIGMVISSEEYSRLSEISAAEWKDYFKKHKDKEHLYKTGENSLTDFIPDLVREIHPSRVKRALIESNVWQNWSIGNHIDIDDLCAICKNHGEPIQSMRSHIGSNRHYDMTLCAVLLRLADIMDFDTSRAPKELFYNRMIDRPTTEEDAVSKSEWEKHMASYGFDFTFDTMLPFYAESTEPNNYYEIVQFLDWIDLELCSCRNEIQLSEKWKNILRLPERIDRTIKAIGFDSYGYKLSIDRDSVIKLLHGENLYAENGAFIRELLQNAIDAVQIRRKMLEHSSVSTDDRHDSEQIYTDESGNVWEPEIIVRSWTEGAYTWISVDDNGIGMNKQIISDYFLNIGKSYYNSEEFRTLVSDETYVANSRFGIGILSCYMMDEDCCRIEVSTKHFSDKRGEATIRISISDTKRYYFLSSKDNDFIPRWNSILTSPQIQKSGRVDSNGYHPNHLYIVS